MFDQSRRQFLGASLAGLAVSAFGAAPPADPFAIRSRRRGGDLSPRPSTLFLTWQGDPTTTMTVQWVGARGETTQIGLLRIWRGVAPGKATLGFRQRLARA